MQWRLSGAALRAVCLLGYSLIFTAAARPGFTQTFNVDDFMNGDGRLSIIKLKVTGVDSEGKAVANTGTAFFISEKGFALTAAHLFYRDRNPDNAAGRVRLSGGVGVIEGRIGGSSESVSVFEFKNVINAELDVALIQLKDPSKRQQFLKVCSSRPSVDENLTTFGFTVDAPLRPIPGIRGNALEGSKFSTTMLINPGDSGGPVITATGKAFGMALSGIREQNIQGYNYFVPLQFVSEFLKAAQVEEDCSRTAVEVVPKPPSSAGKTKIYLRTPDSASPATVRTFYIPLKEILAASASYIEPKAVVVVDQGQKWKPVIATIFDFGLSEADAQDTIRAYLGTPAGRAWLKQLESVEQYVFVVDLASKVTPQVPPTLTHVLRTALLVIKPKGDAVDVILKLGGDVELSDTESDLFVLTDAAVRAIRSLFRKWPPLAYNKTVLADCYYWPMKREKPRPDWMLHNAVEIGGGLHDILKGKSGPQQYTVERADPDRCQTRSQGTKPLLAIEHLAEIMIRVGFYPKSVWWQAYPSWDDKLRFPATLLLTNTPKPIDDFDDDAPTFKTMTQQLLPEIDRRWEEILNALKPVRQ